MEEKVSKVLKLLRWHPKNVRGGSVRRTPLLENRPKVPRLSCRRLSSEWTQNQEIAW
jgi:hypothetical protein